MLHRTETRTRDTRKDRAQPHADAHQHEQVQPGGQRLAEVQLAAARVEAVRRAIDFVCVLSYVNLLEPKQILREEGCDVAVLSINDVGGDRVIWGRMAARLAWACRTCVGHAIDVAHVRILEFVSICHVYCVYSEPHTRGPMIMRFMTQYNPEGRVWQGWRNYRQR